MANTGFICQDAYLKKTEKFSDEQVGRLFRALMIYHSEGIVTGLPPLEELAFDFIKADIDSADAAYKAKCEQNRRNRLSTTDNERQQPSTTVEKAKELPISAQAKPDGGFITDDEAVQIQQEQNRVLDAAEDAGFKMSNDVRASLIALYADNGLDKMLTGLKECSEHGALNLAYLRAVLKGQPRKKTGSEIDPRSFNNFTQRDYAGVQDQIMANLAKEMEEFQATGKVTV